MKKKGIRTAGILIVLLILTGNLIFWCGKKEGYHLDEQYTYHFISSIQYPSINAKRPEGSYMNRWHERAYYQDYLTVSDAEAFDVAGTFVSIKEDVHPPIYYILMELTCSLISRNRFTKWSGMILNLIFFGLTFLFLYKIAKKLTSSDVWALLAVSAYGIGVTAVNTVTFTRMYMVLTCAASIYFYLHVLLAELLVNEHEIQVKRDWKRIAGLIAAGVFGLLTQYYFLVFEFFAALLFGIGLLCSRRFRSAVIYALLQGITVLISIAVWPDIIFDLFGGYRGKEAAENIFAFGDWFGRIRVFLNKMNLELTGGQAFRIMLLLIVLLAAGEIKKRVREKREGTDAHHRESAHEAEYEKTAFLFILGTSLAYVVMVAKIAPYQRSRYIFCVMPYFVILLFVLTRKILHRAGWPYVIQAGTVVILFASVLWSYHKAPPAFLYQGTKEKLQIVSENSELPAIAVARDNRRAVTAGNSIYFAELAKVYPVKVKKLDQITDKLAELKGKPMFVFVDQSCGDSEPILAQVKEAMACEHSEELFLTDHSRVYYISGEADYDKVNINN